MTVLTLKVTSYQSQTLGPDSEKSFDQRGGTFGRAHENDWVLPDPERFISSQHGCISFEDGKFYLTDTSTNGTFLSDRSAPLGKGNSVALKNGDRLTFGDYEISVALIGAADQSEFSQQRTESGGENAGEDSGAINLPNFDPLEHTSPAASSSSDDRSAQDMDARDWSSEAQSDHSSALHDSFASPGMQRDNAIPEVDPSGPAGEQIPEDWDLTGFDTAENESQVKQAPDSDEPPRMPPPEVQAEAPPAPSPEPQSGPPSPESAPSGRSDQSSDDLFERFIAALGLDTANLDGLNQEQAMEDFGILFREIVQGLMEVLRARAELKNEFRMALTTIRPVENNPLKFSPNVDEALRTLFLHQGSGYLSPAEAIHESISDIRNHQIAMITGMQAAFSALMHQLQPESFVKEEEDAGFIKSAITPLGRKSRAWQEYCDFYDTAVRDSGNAFQILFGEEFGRAYEEQIKRLGASTRK